MGYLIGEILLHLIVAFGAGLALGWLIWGAGRSGAAARRNTDGGDDA